MINLIKKSCHHIAKHYLINSAVLASLLCSASLKADDTEIFYAGSSVKPNIMFVVDTSGSMGWRIDTTKSYHSVTNPYRITEMKKALKAIINDSEEMNIGISRFNGVASSVLVPVVALDEPVASRGNKLGRTVLIEAIDAIEVSGGTPAVGAMLEALLYFRGDPIKFARSRSRTVDRVAAPDSYTGGKYNVPSDCDINNLTSSDCRSETITDTATSVATYISPITQTCEKDNNNIVLMTDGSANSNSDAVRATIRALVSPDSNNLVSCTDSYGSGGKCGTELASFMKNQDQASTLAGNQTVTLHTVGFAHDDTWLQALATKGGGEYEVAKSAGELSKSFKSIFGAILEANSTFTSAGVSISNFNRLSHNNDLYFSLFKPSSRVQWAGNLKKYKINDDGEIIGTNGLAIDANTGYFADNAQSYWSSQVDGAEVSLGGAAGKINTATRKVLSNLNGNTLKSFTEASIASENLSLSTFGATSTGSNSADDTLLKDLVKFTRGDRGNVNAPRMSDPLHSKPYVVTYGSAPVIFFGDNQGLLHSIDGETGTENWAFIPQELLKNQNEIRNNPIHKENHVYGLDGSVTAWISSTKKYIYTGMRRGGRSYYALDVTDKIAPKFAWKLTPTSSTKSKDLGQSWSKPVKTKVQINGGVKDVLIISGGYDPLQDTRTTRSTSGDTMGRAIYIVDAATGSILWYASHSGDSSANLKLADMKYSIPSDVKAIDIDGDKVVDQMYVGDTGGQIWRFNLSKSGTIDGYVIARFGDTQNVANNQRFYHAPDLTAIPDEQLDPNEKNKKLLSLAIGSGFQANPLGKQVVDRFYRLSIPLLPPSTAPTVITLNTLLDVTGVAGQSVKIDPAKVYGKNGWYITLSDTGEKVLAASLTTDSEIFFTTFQPSPQAVNCVVAPGTS